MKRALTSFGTRPEVIERAPVKADRTRRDERFQTVNSDSSQHVEPLRPFANELGSRVEEYLAGMPAHPSRTRSKPFFGSGAEVHAWRNH